MKYNTLGWENIEHNVQENKEELINLFELLNELGCSWEETLKRIEQIMKGEQS